jgi:hypothetical protein
MSSVRPRKAIAQGLAVAVVGATLVVAGAPTGHSAVAALPEQSDWRWIVTDTGSATLELDQATVTHSWQSRTVRTSAEPARLDFHSERRDVAAGPCPVTTTVGDFHAALPNAHITYAPDVPYSDTWGYVPEPTDPDGDERVSTVGPWVDPDDWHPLVIGTETTCDGTAEVVVPVDLMAPRTTWLGFGEGLRPPGAPWSDGRSVPHVVQVGGGENQTQVVDRFVQQHWKAGATCFGGTYAYDPALVDDAAPVTQLAGGVQVMIWAEPQLDSDEDEVPDCLDNCVTDPNPEQLDEDLDGIGNPCDAGETDSDGDGVADARDKCPDTSAGEQVDSDGCPTRCTGGADFHYTSAVVVAELAAGVDVMREGAGIRWCTVNGQAYVDEVVPTGDVVANPFVATAFELLGFELERRGGVDPSVNGQGTSAASVDVRDRFDACFDPITLLGFVGFGAGALAKPVMRLADELARELIARSRRLASFDEAFTEALETSVRFFDDLVAKASAELDRGVDRFLKLVPERLRTEIKEWGEVALHAVVAAAVRALDAALRSLESRYGALTRLAREQVAGQLGEAILGVFASPQQYLTACFRFWEPELSFTLPAYGDPDLVPGDTFKSPALTVRVDDLTHTP